MENKETTVKIKIDEKILKSRAKRLIEFSKIIINSAKIIDDSNADIFLRYIEWHRMGCMMMGVDNSYKIVSKIFSAGHDVNHIMLQSEWAKEHGWGEINLEENDFFTTDLKDSQQEFVGMIGDAIFDAIKKKMNASSDEKKEQDSALH